MKHLSNNSPVLYAIIFFTMAMSFPGSQKPSSPKPLREGDRATDFTLKFLNSEQTFTLSHNFGKKPTVLIFGSYT